MPIQSSLVGSRINLRKVVPTLLAAIINQPQDHTVISRTILDNASGGLFENVTEPMLQSLRTDNLVRLLEGSRTMLEDFDFTGLDKHTDSPLQGVYVGVCIKHGKLVGFYVGSSWGEQGVGSRIAQHKDPAYRAKQPHKAFYKMMNDPEVTTHFVMAALFENTWERDHVLLVEGTIACLMGAYDTVVYRNARQKVEVLPAILSQCALNRSDPLGLVEDERLSLAQVESLRQSCLTGDLKHVSISSSDGRGTFYVGKAHFNVSVERMAALKITSEDPYVNVEFQVADSRHDHVWATSTLDDEPGRRLGVRMFKEIEGKTVERWNTRTDHGWKRNVIGRFVANALVDWLLGEVPNVYEHTWPTNRRAFIGTAESIDPWYQAEKDKRKRDAAEALDDDANDTQTAGIPEPEPETRPTKKSRNDLVNYQYADIGREIAEMRLKRDPLKLKATDLMTTTFENRPVSVTVQCNRCKSTNHHWVDASPKWFIINGAYVIPITPDKECMSQRCQSGVQKSRAWSPVDTTLEQVSLKQLQNYVKEAKKVKLR